MNFYALLEVLDRYKVDGVVIGNLNKDYQAVDFPEELPLNFRGGLSGKPCFDLSNELIRQIRKTWKNRFTIIGCGGILSARDAMEKIDTGADLFTTYYRDDL